MKFHTKIFIPAIVIYIVTAIFSVGYYHADEHYQIIEFAGLIEGINQPKDLAWEYHEQIRPAIQPVIAYFVFKTCNVLTISSPYTKAMILRLISAILCLCTIYFFVESCKKTISSEYWKLFIVLSYFLWFIPMISVRFSSETWSGAFFLLSISLVLRDKNNVSNYLLMGALLGLSFLFRLQIAFAIIGLVFWLIIIKKEPVYKIGIGLVSFLVLVLLGIVIDSWYYGSFTISQVNYFVANIIEGKAATFGTSPWYNYFLYVFRDSFFPIGIVILLSFLIVIVKKYTSLVVWIIVPFFIGHSIVSHKEARFLFPIVNLVPLMIIMAIEVLSIQKWKNITRKSIVVFFIIVFSINLTGLCIVSVKPADIGRVRITSNLHKLNTQNKIDMICSSENNPYSPWGITTNFYRDKNVHFINLPTYDFKSDINIDKNSSTVLVTTQKDINDPKTQEIIERLNMKEVYKSMPDFIIPFLKIYGYKMKRIILVYSTE